MVRLHSLQLIAALFGVVLFGCATTADPNPNSDMGAGGATGGTSGGTGAATGTGAYTGTGGGISGTGGGVTGNGGISGTGGGITGNGGISGTGGGITGTGGIGGSGGAGTGGTPITGDVDPVGNDNRAPGFINLAPPMGDPLPATGTTLSPAAPAGWDWYPIDGTVCRDKSGAGIFVHRGTANQLVIFLEGGGACSNVGFCRFNPKNVNEALAGDGSTVLGSAGGAVAGRRQQPGIYTVDGGGAPAGIFDTTNSANPFKDWSMVYIPYCTGDVHFGTMADATVPGTPGGDPRDLTVHQFLGYRNMEKFIGRIVPTFSSVTRVVVTGSSAGSFGAALNFSMIQDSFGNTPVTVIGDSGAPFTDMYMPACMQSKWRETWGLALPPDCTECQHPDGGGLLGFADFLMRKHPHANVALISTMDDQVMRLFFSVGLQNCANYDTADPVQITLFQSATTYMPATQYEGGLNELRSLYQSTNRLATYYMTGDLHQHIFRPTFYTTTAGGVTMSQFVTNFLGGTIAQVGP